MQAKSVLAAALLGVASVSAQVASIPNSQCAPGPTPLPGFFPDMTVSSSGGAAAGDQLQLTMTPYSAAGISAIIVGFQNVALPVPCGFDPLSPTACIIYADVEEFFFIGPFPQSGSWSLPTITIPPGLTGGVMYTQGIEFVPGAAGACSFVGFDFALTTAWTITFE